MKIVAKDNFDRDHISEWVAAEKVNLYCGKIMTAALNKSSGENGAWFFKLEEDDYKLYEFEP